MLIHALGWLIAKLESAADIYRINSYKKHISGNPSMYSLGRKLSIQSPKYVSIGDKTYINGGDIYSSEKGPVKIENNCLISYQVHFLTRTHNYMQSIPINEQGDVDKGIIVEDDVWIGFGAYIMGGVTLAKGSVIGAGSVVTKDTEPYGVYAGIPAKLVKRRYADNMKPLGN